MIHHAEAAFPVPAPVLLPNGNMSDPDRGITVRAHFAAIAMQGFLSIEARGASFGILAQNAVAAADALIEELNKKPGAKS